MFFISLFALHSTVAYKELLPVTIAELATIGELLPGCDVVYLTSLTNSKGQMKSRYYFTLNKRMLIRLWRHGLMPSVETATGQLCVTQKHLSILWMTKSLETLLAWDFLPLLFRENHLMSSWCIEASQGGRMKTNPVLFAAWRQTSFPSGHHKAQPLIVGSRGIDFFLKHWLSWYLRVKPDYNKANKKAISTCIKKGYPKLFPCVRCCCMTLSAAAKPVTVKSSGSP